MEEQREKTAAAEKVVTPPVTAAAAPGTVARTEEPITVTHHSADQSA
jgi:hypothetical protein